MTNNFLLNFPPFLLWALKPESGESQFAIQYCLPWKWETVQLTSRLVVDQLLTRIPMFINAQKQNIIINFN